MSFKEISEIQQYVPLARLGISLAVDIIEAVTSEEPVDEAEFLARLDTKGEEFERVMASVANNRVALRELIAQKRAEQEA